MARRTMQILMQRCVQKWEHLQVELHGQYSVERLHLVHEYAHKCSLLRLLFIVIATPLPCLALISLLDMLPLEPLSTGFPHSYVFRVRAAFGGFCMAYGALIQYQQLIPTLKTSNRQILAMSLFTAAGSAAGTSFFAAYVGFPIPFLATLVAPVFMVFLITAIVVAWGKQLKQDQRVRKELEQYQIVVGILFTLTMVYPMYNYVFVSLDSTAQMWFALLLPVIKLGAKNAISPFCKYIEDFKPEALIFNVEIFHALFVAICMQNTTSIKTTLLIMAMDFAQAMLSLRDIQLVLVRIVAVRGKIVEASRRLSTELNTNGIQDNSPDIGQVMDHILYLIKTDKALQENDAIRVRSKAIEPALKASLASVAPAPVALSNAVSAISAGSAGDGEAWTQENSVVRSAAFTARLQRGSFGRVLNAIPTTISIQEQHVLMAVLSAEERQEYVEATLQLLHMVEFMVLVEYTEVIIPFVYSLYLLIIVRLPNREYYAQLSTLTTATILQAVSNIELYASLELLSFIVLDVYLRYKLQFSPLRQLAYVLEKQWKLVQVKLCVWVLFMIQISLVHYGMDFSFKFDWSALQQPTT